MLIKANINIRALKAAAIAAAKDNSRPYLNGVYVKTIGKTIRYVATDGHRIIILREIVGEEIVKEPDDIPGIIIPLRHIKQLKIDKDTDHAEIKIYKWSYSIKQSSSQHIDGLLINTSYPDYERLIPRKKNLSPKNKNDIAQFNAKYLADFQRAGDLFRRSKYYRKIGGAKIAQITHGRDKSSPALVDFMPLCYVDGFGVIMPVALFEDLMTEPPAWIDEDHPKPITEKANP